MTRIRAIDLFCGAGGSSWGARLAGVEIVAAFDKWSAAKRAYTSNFPDASFFGGSLENRRIRPLKKEIGAIQLILASPECQSHSIAKGAAKRSERSRETATQVIRFAKAFRSRWIVVENVVSMRRWRGYAKFTAALKALGYNISEQTLNAADFGVPQNRRRLYLLCDRKRVPRVVPAKVGKQQPASSVIERGRLLRYSPLRTKLRAGATLERAGRAIAALGARRPFLLVYYGSDYAGGWQRLTQPLRTITTLDRFSLVRPGASGHRMRMLQVPELKRAMGMPIGFSLGTGPRREMIHLAGNAVCPPVMRAIVRALTKP